MKWNLAALLSGVTLPSHIAFENRVPAKRLAGARFEAKAVAGDTAELYIYGDIAFYDITAAMVAEALLPLTAKTLVVHINSYGGDVFDGIAIFNLLRNYAQKNEAKIIVKVDALAASIASVIAMAGDEVIMAKNAQMMIHRASGGCFGTAADMTAMAEILTGIETDTIIPTYAAKTGLSADDLMAIMTAETWMSAQACVDKGFADSVEDDSGVDALLRDGVYDKVPADLRVAKSATNAPPPTPVIASDATRGTVIARMRSRLAALSIETQ